MHVHDRNLGKGAAVRTALEQASGKFACIFDADLEYDPADLRRLLEPLTDGRAEVVYGTRPFHGHTAYSYWYVMGNRAVTTVANVLFNSYLSDIMTCLKMMDLELFRSLRIRSKGFALEAELTGKLLRLRHRIHEVPISYRARTRAEGKKIKVTDALTVVASLLRCRFARGKAGRAPNCGPSLGPSCSHERIA
jgi:glycosyltransferase involved in cell wall biosynthesis